MRRLMCRLSVKVPVGCEVTFGPELVGRAVSCVALDDGGYQVVIDVEDDVAHALTQQVDSVSVGCSEGEEP